MWTNPRLIAADRVAALAIFSVTVVTAIIAFQGLPQVDGRKIVASPYVWPQGCTQARYRVGDDISRACTVPAVAVVHPEKNGLTFNARSRGKQWFRIGNDAIDAFCGFGTGDCTVYSVVPDKFVTRRSSP